jgi:two-component system, LuxR family, response regulator FixJ
MSVYLLDDDPGVRAGMTFAFDAAGEDLQAFASPGELLAEISHQDPSCLILDLQLKGTTGRKCLSDPEFVRKVDMPVIILSGTAEIADVVDTMKWGAVDFLEKPANMSVLLGKVRKALKEDNTGSVENPH